MSSHPRLARGVTITRRQVGEEEIYYLVKDPSGSFHRMGEVEAAVLRLLDGSRSPDEVSADLELARGFRVGVAVIEGFIATLTRSGVVESRRFEPIAFRQEWLQQERARRRTMGQLLSRLSTLKVKLLNPHRFFASVIGPLSFFWTPAFVVSTLALMAISGTLCILHFEEILKSTSSFWWSATSSAGSFASHALIIYVVFFLVVAVHELAHGLTCAHFGGKVTDMGFILFYLQIPGVYCDITDAYSFERRSHRLWVTLAGSYSGLVLASIGVLIWLVTDAGDLLNGIAIAMMFVGGPPVLAFNWNPLLRLDGYYMLMDLLEAPNLMDNSFKYIGYLFKSRVLRVPADRMDVPLRLRKVYVIYGVMAFLFISTFYLYMPRIAYYLFSSVLGEALALLLAAVLGYRLLIRPLLKVLSTLRYSWLSHRPAMLAGQGGNSRLALIGTGAAIAVALALLGPRFAVRGQAIGTLEPLEQIEVRAVWPGFVALESASAMPREGDLVRAGDLLVRLENSELEAERRAAGLDLEKVRLDLTVLQARQDPAVASVRRLEETALAGRESSLVKRVEDLSLKAPIGGVVLTPRLEDRMGRYLKAGEIWCVIGRADRLRVRVPLSERDLGVITDQSEAEVKPLHLPAELFKGRVIRLPAGRRPALPAPDKVAPLLSAAAVSPLAETKPVSGSLEVLVEVDNSSGALRPGMTAQVRIYGERLTLAGHAARSLRRLFKGKLWW